MSESFWGGFYSVCLILFVAVKVGGTALAAWSWWWLLMPAVPDVVLILTATGVQF